MRTKSVLALGLLCSLGLSCGGGSVGAPVGDSHLQVFVHWQNQGLADRRLEILELDAVRLTNSFGIADFTMPPGKFTLRAYVTGPGPAGIRDVRVTTQKGQTTRVEVVDCLLCE